MYIYKSNNWPYNVFKTIKATGNEVWGIDNWKSSNWRQNGKKLYKKYKYAADNAYTRTLKKSVKCFSFYCDYHTRPHPITSMVSTMHLGRLTNRQEETHCSFYRDKSSFKGVIQTFSIPILLLFFSYFWNCMYSAFYVFIKKV